jgi:acyl-CoA-binding protein
MRSALIPVVCAALSVDSPVTMKYAPRKTFYSAGNSHRKIAVALTKPEKPMATSKKKFEAAVANSKSLTERPDNATLLKIYALYKQATQGDNAEKKPGFTDMVGRAKWDAWNNMKGTSADAAMQQYIDLIESLS